MIAFPTSILVLFGAISEIKGAKVIFDNGKGETEIHAPDPSEANKVVEREVFELFEKLKKELDDNGFRVEAFPRGEGIDAIRSYSP